jgi:hypothetical protein
MFGYELSAWGYLLLYLCGEVVNIVKKILFLVGQAEFRLARAFWFTLSDLWNIFAGFFREDEFPDAD